MDNVEKTDEKGEHKEELNLETLFGTPESKQTPDKTDEKKVEAPSSGETGDEDPKELQGKLDALTKELNRVRKGKAESSAEVQELREQLANIQGQLEVMSKGSPSSDTDGNRLAKYTDEQLLQGQTEWEDVLDEERAALRRARADNDEAAFAKATRSANTARATLQSIRKELLERTKRVGAEQAKAQNETTELVQEIAGLYEDAYEAYPDLKDRDSELWKAGNETYNRHPKLMKQLGPMAELVATAMAITNNPKLLSKDKEGSDKLKEARKELLSEINERTEKSLIKGNATSGKKTAPNFEAMPKDQFDVLIHKLKMG